MITNNNQIEIGRAIVAIRRERELNQTELAQKAGISNSYLSEIEKDRRTPDLNVLNKICSALNVSMALLLLKATNEDKIADPDKKRLVREIAPLLERLEKSLYVQTVS